MTRNEVKGKLEAYVARAMGRKVEVPTEVVTAVLQYVNEGAELPLEMSELEVREALEAVDEA